MAMARPVGVSVSILNTFDFRVALLTLAVYQATAGFPPEERYGLTSQRITRNYHSAP